MYGSVRKKFRLSADTTAVASPGARPPISATTMVRAMKTNARFDADTRARSGVSATPSATAPPTPMTNHTLPRSLWLMATSLRGEKP